MNGKGHNHWTQVRGQGYFTNLRVKRYKRRHLSYSRKWMLRPSKGSGTCLNDWRSSIRGRRIFTDEFENCILDRVGVVSTVTDSYLSQEIILFLCFEIWNVKPNVLVKENPLVPTENRNQSKPSNPSNQEGFVSLNRRNTRRHKTYQPYGYQFCHEPSPVVYEQRTYWQMVLCG